MSNPWSRGVPVEEQGWKTVPAGVPRTGAPPWVEPPPGAIDFLGQQRATVVGNAVLPVTQILAQLETPAFHSGVVRELAFQINNLTVGSNIAFALRFNQAPVQGAIIQVFPKNAATDLIEFDPSVTQIRLPVGSTIDVLVTIAAGDIGTYLMGTVYRGWWYHERYDSQWERRDA